MKKIIILVAVMFIFSCGVCLAGAPNSGDGIHDGSGFPDKGAPNSGDGIPDGSGF